MPDSASIPATRPLQPRVLTGHMTGYRAADGTRGTRFVIDPDCTTLPTLHTTTHETHEIETILREQESSYAAVIGAILGVVATGLGSVALWRATRTKDAAPPVDPPTDFGS